MKSLKRIFHEPPKGIAWKWPHYFPIYERYFETLRTKPIKFLEIGIYKGGSLWMWKTYFENSKVIGVDINPDTKCYEGEGVTVCIGDQADKAFLKELGREHGPFDIVLDDGGHRWNQQISSLVNLFEFVVDGGFYVIEDLGNSYSKTLYKHFRRRVRRFPSPPTMKFLKKIIDAVNFRHARRKDPLFSGSVSAISFHAGLVVIEKGKVEVEAPIRSMQYRDPSTKEWVDAEVDSEGNLIR